VIPGLRHLWAEYPDHWTPKVSQARIAAAEAARRPARAAQAAQTEPAQ
jgi:hypothetical protein